MVILIISTIALALSWNILLNIGNNYQYVEGFSNPLGRILQVFSLFEDGSINTESTLSLTALALIDFLKNPIIGSGDEMKWLQALIRVC